MVKKRNYLFLFILWFVFCTTLFLLPSSFFGFGNNVQSAIPHLDKYVHMIIFFMFSLFFYQFNKNLLRSAIICIVFTAFYGIIIEILQRIVGRGFDIWDYIFDFIGVGIFFNVLFLFKLIKNLFVSKQNKLPII